MSRKKEDGKEKEEVTEETNVGLRYRTRFYGQGLRVVISNPFFRKEGLGNRDPTPRPSP